MGNFYIFSTFTDSGKLVVELVHETDELRKANSFADNLPLTQRYGVLIPDEHMRLSYDDAL